MTRLEWPSCVSARDLGGVCVDGGEVPHGVLMRSDNHDLLNEDGMAAVRAAGVCRIIDLRAPEEAATYPSPFRDDPVYRNVPTVRDDLELPDHVADEETYRIVVDAGRDLAAEAFRTLADAPPGAVAVHCHSGRDRTGLLVAFALTVAGAASEDVVADYVLTDTAEPGTMRATLEHIDRTYGGVVAYLRGGGVTDQDLAAVRRRLGAAT